MTTLRFARCLLLSFAVLAIARAQSTTGAVEGRVFNPATGEYLENARVTLSPSGREAFTDSLGQYTSPTSRPAASP